MYARGILFGKMKYELGDHSFVRCPEHNLVADMEFKTKGYFGGTYNAIGGSIRNEKTGETLYELSGMWSGEMFAKSHAVRTVELLLDLADGIVEWSQRAVVRCNTRQAHNAHRKALGRARRP